MQIQNNTSVTSGTTANPSQPNVGDILQVTVKQRVNNQAAVVSMKGTTSNVIFEGNVPEQDKVIVEITGKTAEGNYTVKVSDKNPTPTTAQQNALQNSNSQLSEAVKVFTSSGMTVTKENVASIKDFLTNGSGSIEEKMDTLRMMVQKQIPISDNTLKSVHEALNGKPLSSTLLSVLDELGMALSSKSSQTLDAIRTEVQREPDVIRAIQIVEDYLKSTELDTAIKNRLEKSILEAKRLVQAGQSVNARVQFIQNLIMIEKQSTSSNQSNQLVQSLDTTGESSITTPSSEESALVDSIRNLIKDMQKEPSLVKILEKTADFLTEQGSDEKMGLLKKVYEKAQQLQEQGRELAARREISNALSLTEKNSISQQESTEHALSQVEQYAINETIQSLKLDAQNVMVTEITKKLSQMAIDFRTLKQELAKNLDNVSKMLENRNVLPQANGKQILESTIHKLDNTILKGDFLLYTDMATEKKLLSSSSQLAEAKKLLAKGEISEANKLVKEVKATIDNLVFKPSDVKVKHLVSDKLGFGSLSETKPITNTLEQIVQPFSSNESSSRQMYEAIRKLGLMHETDAGFSLVSKSGNVDQIENVKATLLKIMQNGDGKSQLTQQAEQAVNSITGQQLLNKQDSSGQQNLFFQLPFLMEKKIENIKIYVNSRKDSDKVDWENCSIYFVLETKKLGNIGVLLSSSEKNVSLTFRSNKDNLGEQVKGLTEITQERFKEIGYNLSTMNVKPLQEQREPTSTIKKEKNLVELTPTFTKKGYDFSI